MPELHNPEPWLAGWLPWMRETQGVLAFDVGANAGEWSAILSEIFYRVISVEPDVRCHAPEGKAYDRRAVWSHSGEAVLYGREDAAQSSLLPTHSIGRGKGAPVSVVSTKRVACVTLDQLAEEHGPPDFVKIDIEGAEAFALEGATAPCFSRCQWLIELHDTRESVLPQMHRLGYQRGRFIPNPCVGAVAGHEWAFFRLEDQRD